MLEGAEEDSDDDKQVRWRAACRFRTGERSVTEVVLYHFDALRFFFLVVVLPASTAVSFLFFRTTRRSCVLTLTLPPPLPGHTLS